MNTNLLKKLIEIQSVTFDTDEISNFVKKNLSKAKFTKNKNVYWGPDSPKTIFIAHIDEIGFKIKKINENGLVNLRGIGWVNPQLLAGQTFQVKTAKGKIVNGIAAYHKALSPRSIKKWDDVFVDFGFDSKKQLTKSGIVEGCFGTYKKDYWENDDKIIASSIDNRLSVWMCINLINKLSNKLLGKKIGFLFTTDEEESNQAATGDLKYLKPEIAIAVDVVPHSLGLKNLEETKKSPWILYKTPDYKLSKQLAKIFSQTGKHFKLAANNKYLLKSEPFKYQKIGVPMAANLLTPVINYHHNLYSVEKTCVKNTARYLEKLIKII